MSTPFLGEIKVISWEWAPKGWAHCDGKSLPVNQYSSLHSLLGYTYGGSGPNFNLPDLRDRIVPGAGHDMPAGQKGGEPFHTLTHQEMPTHRHLVVADNNQAPPNGNQPGADKRLAGSQPGNLYGSAGSIAPMNDGSLIAAGGGQPHENRQPFLALKYIIAMIGLYPDRAEGET